MVHHIHVGQKKENLNFLLSCLIFLLQNLMILENKFWWIPASSPVWSEYSNKILAGRLPNIFGRRPTFCLKTV